MNAKVIEVMGEISIPLTGTYYYVKLDCEHSVMILGTQKGKYDASTASGVVEVGTEVDCPLIFSEGSSPASTLEACI